MGTERAATVSWWDERLSLGVLYVATSLAEDLEEAAALDGASVMTTVTRIVAPLAGRAW